MTDLQFLVCGGPSSNLMRAKRAALREIPRIPSPHSFSALWHDTSMGWYMVQVHWCISPVNWIHHYHSAIANNTGGITGYYCNNTTSWSWCLLTHRTQCICRCRWRCPWLLWRNTRSRWTWATGTGSYPRKTKPCRILRSYVWFGFDFFFFIEVVPNAHSTNITLPMPWRQ